MTRRISLFLLVCAFMSLGLTQMLKAQDAPELAGFVVISGESGTLEEGDEGVYELTLEGVAPTSVWVVNAPELFSGWYDTAIFASQWAANTDTPLTTTALLKTETITLRMTGAAPSYDPMTGTFTLEVSEVEAFPVEESKKKKGSDVPDEFELANLSFVIDSTFSAGLAAGDEILAAEGRQGQQEGLLKGFPIPTPTPKP